MGTGGLNEYLASVISNVPFWPCLTIPFSNEKGMEECCFGLLFPQNCFVTGTR